MAETSIVISNERVLGTGHYLSRRGGGGGGEIAFDTKKIENPT